MLSMVNRVREKHYLILRAFLPQGFQIASGIWWIYQRKYYWESTFPHAQTFGVCVLLGGRALWSLLGFSPPSIHKCSWLPSTFPRGCTPCFLNQSHVIRGCSWQVLFSMSSSAVTPPQTAIYKERDVLRLVVLKTGKAKSIVTSMDLSPRGHLLEFLGWVLYFFLFCLPRQIITPETHA